MTVEVALTDDLQACFAVRRAVFIDEQGVSEAEELDGQDDTALHLLARDHGHPVGTARLLLKGDTLKIGRVCVLASHRGSGLGKRLIMAALDVAKGRAEVTRAQLGAQVSAIGFYEKLGFSAFGPNYLDAGIDHRDMDLRV